MSITRPDMDRAAFVSRFGAVYEHSAWVAEAVWDRVSGDLPQDPDRLNASFRDVILEAGRESQLGLLRAHPELGVAEAERKSLTSESRNEQAGAGLDACTAGELAAFRQLNAEYREKFGFPFIIAVRGRGRSEILEIFRQRLENGPVEEFDEALRQVMRIGLLRIGEILDG